MNRMLRAILVILFVLGSITTACQSEAPQVGKPAPDFQAQTLDGQSVSLSDLKGKAVIVNFWATSCGYCVYEMPFLQEIHDEWSDRGLVVLAINIGESASKITSFMQGQRLSLPVLLDSEGNIARKYNIPGIPTSFFIDKDGIIQDMKVGPFQSKAEIESSLSKLAITK